MNNSLEEKWIVCRVCLRQPADGEIMINIFDHDETKDMTHMILECGGVPIKPFDHYPDKICEKCLKYLRVAYKFRITCQRSHQHLSRFIAPVVVEKLDYEPEETGAFKYDEQEDAELERAIKSEFGEEEEEVMEIYEPMDEIDEAEIDNVEYEDYEQTGSPVSGEVEYLVELNEFFEDDGSQNFETLDNKSLMVKQMGVQKPSTSRAALGSMNKQIAAKKETLKSALKRGPRPKQEKPTSYICDVCGNIYNSQGRLTEHIKLHNGIKPHECEICGHRFAQTQQLARHMNTHTGNRPYKCIYCPAAFADLSTRNKHHRIHTNERPYVCDVCGKSFTYTNTLKFHKMIHTGEKPHVCDICGKGFQQAYKLRNHKVTHEKRNPKILNETGQQLIM